MVKIIFYPPIGEPLHKVEYSIAMDGEINLIDFIEKIKQESQLKECFENIAAYSSSGNILQNLIVVVNDKVVDAPCYLHDGDVVKLLLPLAGG